MDSKRLAIACCVLWTVISTEARAAPPLPERTGHVTDAAGLLEPEARADLEDKLASFEARTGHDVAVLLVARAPGSLERLAGRVREKWALGDGVLLSVSRAQRVLRTDAGAEFHDVLGTAPSEAKLWSLEPEHVFSVLDGKVSYILNEIGPPPQAAPSAPPPNTPRQVAPPQVAVKKKGLHPSTLPMALAALALILGRALRYYNVDDTPLTVWRCVMVGVCFGVLTIFSSLSLLWIALACAGCLWFLQLGKQGSEWEDEEWERKS